MTTDKLKRIQTQLLGLASINGILMVETVGSDYWGEWTKELSTLLQQAGEELEAAWRGEDDTQEMLAVEIEERAS